MIHRKAGSRETRAEGSVLPSYRFAVHLLLACALLACAAPARPVPPSTLPAARAPLAAQPAPIAVQAAAEAEPDDAHCVGLTLVPDTEIRFEGTSTVADWPDTHTWPEQVLAAVRAYCARGFLRVLPPPQPIVRIAFTLAGTAAVELRVGEAEHAWPVELMLARAADGQGWSVAPASLERTRARAKLMALAQYLEEHLELELLSATQLRDDWWRARARDAGGSTICVLHGSRDEAHCYRDPRAIEHLGTGPIDWPRDRGSLDDDTRDIGAPRFALTLWPLAGRDPARTTEVWLFDSERRQTCRAGWIATRRPVANPLYDFRSPGPRTLVDAPRAPKVDDRHCEQLSEVPAPEWVALVRGMNAAVVPGRDGLSGVALRIALTSDGDEDEAEGGERAEAALCVRDGGMHRCGLTAQGTMVEELVGKLEEQTLRHDLQRRPSPGAVRRLYGVEIVDRTPGFRADETHDDSIHLYLLELAHGRWAWERPPLRLGTRQRSRSVVPHELRVTRDYARATLLAEDMIQLDLVLSESLRYRADKRVERKLGPRVARRRCMTMTIEDVTWVDRPERCARPQ